MYTVIGGVADVVQPVRKALKSPLITWAEAGVVRKSKTRATIGRTRMDTSRRAGGSGTSVEKGVERPARFNQPGGAMQLHDGSISARRNRPRISFT